jgi:hypothetical protein
MNEVHSLDEEERHESQEEKINYRFYTQVRLHYMPRALRC